MSKFTSVLGTAVVAAGLALATQASAHHVLSGTTPVPSLAPGASQEFTITCPHHQYMISGGYENNDQLNATGPLVVTASYPKTTRSWAVEVTNRSGRPTSVLEAELTLYVTCDHHW